MYQLANVRFSLALQIKEVLHFLSIFNRWVYIVLLWASVLFANGKSGGMAESVCKPDSRIQYQAGGYF